MNLNMLEMLIDEGFNAQMIRVGGEELVEVIVGEKIFWLNYIFKENNSKVEVSDLAHMNCQIFSSVTEAIDWIESQ